MIEREKPIMKTVREFAKELFYMYYECKDKIRGVDFYAYKDAPPPDPEIGNHYQVSSPLFYRYIKQSVRGNSHSGDALIDVGCGKGRMLEFFSRLGFGTVDGLEYSPQLAAIGEANMRKLGLSSKIFIGDAAKWTNYDVYNYVFLFNPFPANVMEQFASKLQESIQRNPRKVIILYVNPKHIGCIETQGFFLEDMIRKKHGSLAIFSNIQSDIFDKK